ncbi:hypothetical protein [Algoriphagus sp. PAP.12]|uniref:hypothetical protein n=1 Tax=Algoriphagus sp. PAP.12 TaxID=2996678 RepID=UPI00227B4D18|nr:hypothetical protein [Algoriphagus sp. PAP.12]
MSWGTKEQKGELLLLGLTAGLSFLNNLSMESDKYQKEAKENINSIDEKELKRILEINEEYSTRIYNLLNDTELGCKFKKTEEIFLMVIEIIMLDLEYDYYEIIQNFTNSFDNEDFIRSHELAIKLREKRLKEEYEENLKVYQESLLEYQEKKKSQSFFKSIFGEALVEPMKPILRS